METRASQLYKKMTIKWTEGSMVPFSVSEKMVITNTSIKFERKTDRIFDSSISNDDCKWEFKSEHDNMEEKFSILCNYYLRHMRPELKFHGCDVPIFSIEVIRYDNTKEKEEYMGDLTVNGFDKLIEMIKELIPSFMPTPYFIDAFAEIDEDEI